ncbi:MAG: glycosyltransferase [Candidatus Moraniibacteriota bacterium]
MKVALVHDYLVQHGGAERVLEVFADMFPEAPIFTLIHDREAMHGAFEDHDIQTSFLQRVPWAKRNHRLFPMLMPLAIEQFDFRDFDLVISDSSSYAKGIITGPNTLHVCYMHTPMRYAWDDCHKYVEDFGFPRIVKRTVPFFMSPVRLWDQVSASRPDHIIANSRFVATRIAKYYRRSAEVIHPPVDVHAFGLLPLSERSDYFLMVGRLIAYKRHDIAIRAFNELRLPLKIIGRGPEYNRLRKLAGPTIEFLGRVSDADLPRYYSACRAFIFPQEEDFGIVAFEAFASGRPLIAFRGGDIPEHLEEGKMGMFFNQQTVGDIVSVVRRFRDADYDANAIRQKALAFDRSLFREKIRLYLDRVCAGRKI